MHPIVAMSPVQHGGGGGREVWQHWGHKVTAWQREMTTARKQLCDEDNAIQSNRFIEKKKKGWKKKKLQATKNETENDPKHKKNMLKTAAVIEIMKKRPVQGSATSDKASRLRSLYLDRSHVLYMVNPLQETKQKQILQQYL